MSELTLRFGEARLHVEGDADLVARERAAFLEHLGRLDRQSEKAGELLAVLLRAGARPRKGRGACEQEGRAGGTGGGKECDAGRLMQAAEHPRRLRQSVPVEAGEG